MRSHTPRHWNYRKDIRRGGVLVVAVVCLVVSSMILASLTQIAVLSHRQQRAEAARMQTAWLAESGLERAADRLAADRNYSGELWTIPAAELGGQHDGRVEITIASPRSDDRVVTVVAVYPANAPGFAKVTKQVTLRLKSQP